MSNKRILNLTAKKKKDVMKTWTNMDANDATGELRNGPAYMQGGPLYAILWSPTARPGLNKNGAAGAPIEEAVRTSSTCYMRGIKETISLASDTGAAWKWRRICFRLRGDFVYSKEGSGALSSYLDSNFGMVRVATNWAKVTSAINDIYRILFKGVRNVDWVDPMLAPTDNRRWDIVYDKTTNIQSPNEAGVYRTYQRWHGMNKNLVFDDDENANSEELRRWSVEGKQGMGDYYIIDLFNGNGAAEDQMSVRYNSTLYWHEK